MSKLLGSPGALCLRTNNPQAVLFGTTVNIGPAMISTEHTQVSDLEATLRSFNSASIGEAVQITFEPVSPVVFSIL